MVTAEASITQEEEAEQTSAKLLEYAGDEHSDSGVCDRARTAVETLKQSAPQRRITKSRQEQFRKRSMRNLTLRNYLAHETASVDCHASEL